MEANFTIMIADDDSDDRHFISAALRRSNFNGVVKCVEDGHKLINALRKYAQSILPDLILLDLNMPLKDGFEALAEIKNDDALKQIPTIVITTSVSKIQEEKCMELGASAFYSKPISMPDYDIVAAKIMAFVRARI